jgi:hypothetical protein
MNHCTNIYRQYQLPSSSLAFNTAKVCSLQEYTANSGILTQELQIYIVHTLVKMKGTTIPVADGEHEWLIITLNILWFTHPSTLHEIGNHHNDCYMLFPNHTPETIKCCRQWSLSTYVCPCPLETINIVSVDIIDGTLLSGNWQNLDSAVVIWNITTISSI